MDTRGDGLPPGWDARLGLNGRIFYYSKHSHTVQILPPPEAWKCVHGLPYGWEMAVDYETKPYYINHLTQSVSYEDPRTEADQFSSSELSPGKQNPVPRRYEIRRDPKLGFGFIAGSEKPVIIRSVTPGGPSEGMLLPDDQIVKIDSENVLMEDRQHVIELIREKNEQVTLTVLQPNRSENSSFLKPAKKTIKGMDRPKVRFADDTIVNGQEQVEGSSPLLVSPGVLRILLENRQARSFQYLPDTTAGEAVAALCDKLELKDPHLFSLVLASSHEEEPVQKESKSRKSSSRSSSTDEHQIVSSSSPDSVLVAPWDCISKVVNNPSMRHHSCHFRLEFMPKDFHQLARNDPEAFRYLYMQCVNDVISGEVYNDALTRDEILKLASIHMQELVLTATLPSTFDQDIQEEQDGSKSAETYQSRNKFRFPSLNNKINLKYVEKEYGLRRFLPPLLLSKMQQDSAIARYVRKAIQQHLKTAVNTSSLFSQRSSSTSTPVSPVVPANRSTETTLLQLRLQYLKTLSPQHLFGGRYFDAAIQTLMESDVILLVGHHYGISQMINSKTKMVSILAEFQHITGFEVAACSNESSNTTVRIEFAEMKPLMLSMDPQSAHNLAFMVAGYCRVYGNVDMVLTLPLSESTSVPLYFGPHKVKPSTWNYPSLSSYKPRNVVDVYAPSLAGELSPMYFYCDFSEPVTPAVLSQDSSRLDIPRSYGVHVDGSLNREIVSGVGEEAQILSVDKLSNLESSDTNNNNSFHESDHESIYEEIKPPHSLPESPVSSLSTGQYSEPTPSHSPMYLSRDSSQRISQQLSADGYELPILQVRRQLSQISSNSETEGEGDWNLLMEALKVSKPDEDHVQANLESEVNNQNEVKELDLPPPPLSLEDIIIDEQELKNPMSDDSKVAETLIKPQPLEPQLLSKTEICGSVEARLRSRSLPSDTCSEQSGKRGSLKRHRMSSFKPNETELKVFTQSMDNATAGSVTNFTASSPVTGSGNASVEINSTSFGEVKDEATRKKLQETEELIQYFREKREQVCGSPDSVDAGSSKMDAVESTSDPTIYTSSAFAAAEIDQPVITTDIAAGNKRLRKAEKAASKNRKSWAGGDTLTRSVGLDDNKYISMSNPDLPSSFPRKRRKGFFWRIFGRKSRTMSSMYDTNGMNKDYSSKSSIKSKTKSSKKFHFPKFQIKRAFTFGSHSRHTSLPLSESPKQRRFTFRPFSHKKKSSRGFVIISEPSDNVRGVDLLPSGKYTVAGTMFQVNTDSTEIQDNVFHSGSEEGTPEVSPDMTETAAEQKVTQVGDFSEGSEPHAESFTKQIQNVKLRTVSKRDNERPSSFLTFVTVEQTFPAEEQQKVTPVEIETGETTTSKENLMEEDNGKEQELEDKSQSYDDLPMEELLVERRAGDLAIRRAQTLPQNFQLPTEDDIPGSKLMKLNKPSRKLVPVYDPIIPEVISKSSTLPAVTRGDANATSSLLAATCGDIIATSTPVPSKGPSKAIVKRKSTKKRRAPPPPQLPAAEVLPERNGGTSVTEFVIAMTTKNTNVDIPPETMKIVDMKEIETEDFPSFKSNIDDDVVSEGQSSMSDHSLVTEIFSYLEKSENVKENVLDDDIVLDTADVTDFTLPYDENYVMPGLHVDDLEIARQEEYGACSKDPESNIPEHNMIMYQMFYDELMAESNIKREDCDNDASSELSSLQDMGRENVQPSHAACGGDFIDDDEDFTHTQITDLSTLLEYSKEEFNTNSQESDSGTSTMHENNIADKIDMKRNAMNFMTNGARSPLKESPLDVADSSQASQVPSVSTGRKLPTRSPSYFVYHHLITPVGYEKHRMNDSSNKISNKIIRRRSTLDRPTSFDFRQKPPLPPKPIFH